MNSLTFPPRGTHCVVVDGPECNDAAFAAQWLEMASEADRLLRMVFCHDLELRPDWLIFEGTHPFSETALEFISRGESTIAYLNSTYRTTVLRRCFTLCLRQASSRVLVSSTI